MCKTEGFLTWFPTSAKESKRVCVLLWSLINLQSIDVLFEAVTRQILLLDPPEPKTEGLKDVIELTWEDQQNEVVQLLGLYLWQSKPFIGKTSEDSSGSLACIGLTGATPTSAKCWSKRTNASERPLTWMIACWVSSISFWMSTRLSSFGSAG